MFGESQRIVVYPDRAKLTGYAILFLMTALLVAILGIAALRAVGPLNRVTYPTEAIPGAIAGIIALPISILLGVLCLLTLYRVVVRKPSVVVTEDGIFDGCSLVASGVGLLRWEEIEAIWSYEYEATYAHGSTIRRHYLAIMPRRPDLILARRGAIAQLFARSITLTLPARTSLPDWLLSTSVDEICERIRAAYPNTLEVNRIGVLMSAHSRRVSQWSAWRGQRAHSRIHLPRDTHHRRQPR